MATGKRLRLWKQSRFFHPQSRTYETICLYLNILPAHHHLQRPRRGWVEVGGVPQQKQSKSVEGGRRDEGRRGSRLQPLPCSCRDEKAAEEICRQLPSGRGWASTRGTEERVWASAKAFQRTREQLLLGGKSRLIWILFLKHCEVLKRRVLLNQLGIQMARISSARWTTEVQFQPASFYSPPSTDPSVLIAVLLTSALKKATSVASHPTEPFLPGGHKFMVALSIYFSIHFVEIRLFAPKKKYSKYLKLL